jgi:hypothetical protein
MTAKNETSYRWLGQDAELIATRPSNLLGRDWLGAPMAPSHVEKGISAWPLWPLDDEVWSHSPEAERRVVAAASVALGGRAPAPPACEAIPQSSLLMRHAGRTRWGRQRLTRCCPAKVWPPGQDHQVASHVSSQPREGERPERVEDGLNLTLRVRAVVLDHVVMPNSELSEFGPRLSINTMTVSGRRESQSEIVGWAGARERRGLYFGLKGRHRVRGSPRTAERMTEG